jgi:hypothetical protein
MATSLPPGRQGIEAGQHEPDVLTRLSCTHGMEGEHGEHHAPPRTTHTHTE